MTYGQFLKYCRTLAGVATKSEFSRKLGMLNPDHYIGTENDNAGKKPSLELLERAARLAGHEFHDAIQEFKPLKYSREHKKIHDQLQELLDLQGVDSEAGEWIAANVRTFHRAYLRRR